MKLNPKSIKVFQKHPLNQLQSPKAERTKGESNLQLHGNIEYTISILRGRFALGWNLCVCVRIVKGKNRTIEWRERADAFIISTIFQQIFLR